MAETVGELDVVLRANFGSAQATIDKARSQFRNLNAEAEKVQKSTAGVGRVAAQASTGMDKLRSSVERAKQGMDRMERGVTLLTRGFKAFLAVEAVRMIADIGKAAITSTAELGRLSAQAGLTAEQFQTISFAVRNANVGQQELAQASATLARNLSELKSGTGSLLQYLQQSNPELVAQFERASSVNQAWQLVAETISKLPNEYERIRFAQIAVSEAGARMVNEISKGPRAFSEARRQLAELGALMEDRTVKQAQELERKFNDLVVVIGTKLKKAAVAAGQAFGFLEKASPSLRSRLDLVNSQIEHLQRTIEDARPDIEAHARGVHQTVEELAKWDPQAKTFVETLGALNEKLEEQRRILFEIEDAELSKMYQEMDEAAAAAKLRIDGVVNSLKEQIKLAGMTDAQRRTAEELSRAGIKDPTSPEAQMIAGLVGQLEAAKGAGALSRTKAADEADDLIARLMGERSMLDELNFSWNSYTKTVQKAQEAIRASTTSSYEANRQIAQLELELNKQREQAAWDLANAAAGALAQLFPKNKAFAIANAIVNTAEGVTKALSAYPPPFNFGLAAAVAAAGFAQVNAIRSANPGGGGSLTSPSQRGSSATAQIPQPEQATPIPPTKGVTIVIPPGDIFSREQVVRLIDELNNEVQNGRTLISTRTR